MARLESLPALSIIKDAAGLLDYYIYKGRPCVRSWPTWRRSSMSQAMQTAADNFAALNRAIRDVPAEITGAAQEQAAGTVWTWHDVLVSLAYGGVFTLPAWSRPVNVTLVKINPTQSIPNTTPTDLSLGPTPVVDNESMYDPTNPTQLKVPFTSVYAITARIHCTVNTVGQRTLDVWKNGVLTVPGPKTLTSTFGDARLILFCVMSLATNDLLTFRFTQTSGAAMILTDGEIAALDLLTPSA